MDTPRENPEIPTPLWQGKWEDGYLTVNFDSNTNSIDFQFSGIEFSFVGDMQLENIDEPKEAITDLLNSVLPQLYTLKATEMALVQIKHGRDNGHQLH